MIEFTLPELGEGVEEVEVSTLLIEPGDQVHKDQPVVEVETEKASLEVPVSVGGKVTKILVEPGTKVRVGQPLLQIEPDEGSVASKPSPEPEPPPESAEPQAPAQRAAAAEGGAAAAPQAEPEADRVVAFPSPRPAPAQERSLGDPAPAAPSVRRLARELGIDIDWVPGTGPGGRISADDVKRYAKQRLSDPVPERPAAPAASPAAESLPDPTRWGTVRREPLDGIRRATAANMRRAWSQVPHVTQFDSADVTELEQLRKQYGARVAEAGGKLTITAIVIKTVAGALRHFPKFNASLDLEHDEVVLKDYVHVGVAVDTDRGLLVPVVRDVDRKNVTEIAVELGDLARRARDKKLKPDEMQGACFTVSNLGGLGTTYFSPIVNWPEVAILGVGRAELKARFDDGRAVPRSILPLSVSYDHRWIDGADAARFLRWVAEALEQPLLLALEG